MPFPPSNASPKLTQFAKHAWWILLLIGLGLLWQSTARRIDRVDLLTNSPNWSVDAPERDNASPTGYVNGQRNLFVPGHHTPSFWWITEAQKSVEQGAFRLRHIDYDSTPEGRELRRTSPYRWWLIASGWLYGSIKDEPIGYSIERGALIADPILLALMLLIGSAYCARYLGTFSALGFVALGISIFPLTANFQPGAPDSHSLAWVLALGSILPLAAALRLDHGAKANKQFAIAGLVGGLGFWNDATSQAPVLLAVFLGGLCYELLNSKASKEEQTHPSHWRIWAIAGAITTLGGSLFEFAPNHFSLSLDAINPIHALAWLGLGELLTVLSHLIRDGRKALGKKSAVLLTLAVLAIAAWPHAGITSETGSLFASDFLARQLANHPNASMSANLGTWLNRSGDAGAKWATLLPCAILILATTFLCPGTMSRKTLGRVGFALIAALTALVLAVFQLRFWNLFDALALVAIAAIFAEASSQSVTARLKMIGASTLTIPGLLVGFPSATHSVEAKDLSTLERQVLIERDFSHWLAKRSDPQSVVLLSTPLFSGGSAFYGGFRAAISSDDQYEPALQAAVRILSTNTPEEATILLSSRLVTHVALPTWDPTLDQLVHLGTKVPVGQQLPQNAFAVALQYWSVPSWMRTMNYSVPNETAFKGFDLRPFELQAEQPEDIALSQLADLFIDRGMQTEAGAIREILEKFPRSVPALGAIANIDLAMRDSAKLGKSLETLIPYLSRRAARDLPIDRRISLAILFAQTNKTDLARDQLTACFESLDIATLRTLTPNSTAALVVLSQTYDIPFPNKELETTALELIGPVIRERLKIK